MNIGLIALIHALLLCAGCAMGAVEGAAGGADDEAVGTTEDAITGGASAQYGYTRGLVRLDFVAGGGCSAVLLGPNLLATSAHCLDDKTIDGVSNWNGMKYGQVQVRMVYKPSSTETMCLNETCRNSNGTVRSSTVYAFWDAGFAGSLDPADDIAVLTRITQNDFLTKAEDPGDPAPRALDSNDYLRVLGVSLPTGSSAPAMSIAGYGDYADDLESTTPRRGAVEVYDWNTETMLASYDGAYWAAPCAGDSGGPISYTPGIGTHTYAAGLISGSADPVTGSCPELGDDAVFTRLSSKIWLLNRVRDWVEGQECHYSNSGDLPGNGLYYWCW
jgi:hypothetical protein